MATAEDTAGLDSRPEREELHSTISGLPVEPLYSPENVDIDYERDLGAPGEYPVHARRAPVDVPRAAVDDAPVRRLRHGGGDERALPLPARARPDRPVDGVRHADADGLRLGPSAVAGRGRPRGGGDRLARRHGDPVRRHPARRGLDLDDDQLAGGDPARVLRLRSATSRASRATELSGTVQNDILKEYIAQKEYIFPPEPSMRLVVDMIEWCCRRAAAHAPGLDLRLPHPRGGLDGGAGARVHARRRLRLRRARRSSAASTWTRSRRGCRSSSTRTSTSSRRSPSTARRGGSGRASCATATARRIRARG